MMQAILDLMRDLVRAELRARDLYVAVVMASDGAGCARWRVSEIEARTGMGADDLGECLRRLKREGFAADEYVKRDGTGRRMVKEWWLLPRPE